MSSSQSPQDENDNAGIRVPPPLIFFGFLIVGLLAQSEWIDGQFGLSWLTLLGGLIAVLGLGILIKTAPKHAEAGTNIEPWEPTTAIIRTGLYAYTRNPIYLGMAVTYVGIAIAAGSLGALVTLIFALIVIQTYVIAREERYLTAKFGEEYLDYKNSVRRWI